MLTAIKSLIIVCFIVIVCFFLAWFYLHNKGLSHPHPLFQNGFFKTLGSNEKSVLLIALRGESVDFPENTLQAFEAAAALDSNIVLWADVLLSRDGIPVVTRYQDLSIYGVENSFVPLLSYAEIQKIDAGFNFQNQNSEFSFRGKGLQIMALKQLVEKFPNHRFVINLADDSVGFEGQLVKAIDYNDKTRRFIITSERDKILKETRKVAPMLLYGASTPQLTQLMILANLFLESIAPLDSDLLIVENVTEKVRSSVRIHLNEKMIQEAHRRSLKVFAGNAQTLEQAQALIQLGVDGVLTSHPIAYKSFFEKHDFSR